MFDNLLKTYLEKIKYDSFWPIKEVLEVEDAYEEMEKLQLQFNEDITFAMGYPMEFEYINNLNNKVHKASLILK